MKTQTNSKIKNLFARPEAKREPQALRVERQADETSIYIYDYIASDTLEAEFWGGISPEQLIEALAQAPGIVHLRINSPGGSVFAARAMQTAIRQHTGKIIAHVDGLAASAATFLVMGADEAEMAEGAFLMIHESWAVIAGNKKEMRHTADLLEKIDGSIANDYQRKSGASAEQVAAWMAEETWFTAQEALDAKLIDRVFDGASLENKFDLSAFDHAPAALMQQPAAGEPKVEESPVDSQAMIRRLQFFTDFGN